MALTAGREDFPEQCQLLSGWQSYLVQMFLFLVALTSLWYKRHVERPKRSLEIWAMDVGKQGIGCVWYFLNFVIDITLGMVISLSLLRLQQELALWLGCASLFDSGDYGNPPSYRIWGTQLTAWLSIIIFSKGIVTSVLIATATPLSRIGNALFSPLAGHPLSELVVVMIIIPSFLNVVQFWVQDSFLKRDTSNLVAYYSRSKTKHAQVDASLQIGLLESQ